MAGCGEVFEMAVPKTGAVVITRAIEHICRLAVKYGPPLQAFIAASVTAGLITSSEAALIQASLTAVQAACTAWKKLTGY